jgi:hypothetical protein
MPEKNGDTRYGHRSGSGANEPKRHEKKEQAPDWRPRQGGDQTRSDPEKQRELEEPGVEASNEGPIDQTTSTDGPGGGGATEWPGRAKHHEGLHGGPSRRK